MKDNFKFKNLTLDELVISLDRLTRFKLPEISYYRVFSEIISKCLITPKLSKHDIENIDAYVLSSMVEKIWNTSVKDIFNVKFLPIQNKVLKILISETYKNIDNYTKTLVNAKLNIDYILNSADSDKLPINLRFLKQAKNFENYDEIIKLRKEKKLLFPIQKLLIVEGITEEILLPVFAKKFNSDFYENGIYVLGAGGKSKSPALYSQIHDKIKVPVILLFDNDAKDICDVLQSNIDPKDKIICIQKGEFEDILSVNLIKRVLNNEYEPASAVSIYDLKIHKRMCENIEEVYRTRHLGEFKKSKFAKLIAESLKYETDISEDIKLLIQDIISLAR